MNDAHFAQWMKRMDGPLSADPLPDVEAIWWRAQLRQRIVAADRATRPLRIAEQLACTVCLIAAAVAAGILTWGPS